MTRIQILGTGCKKCKQQSDNAEQAARELGIEIELTKVTDLNEIMNYGVMMTPGIAINGVVKASGRLIDTETIKAWLQEI
jgi:small redox-active disulfide protein 2